MKIFDLTEFVRQSNLIEGINREPTQRELDATASFLSLPKVTISDLESFVHACAPGHVIRDQVGQNVRVGNHIAPAGGPRIRDNLQNILDGGLNPWDRHCSYETLHPFTDGNGRSGRVLWLYDMGGIGHAPLGFLHHFYYQTLELVRRY